MGHKRKVSEKAREFNRYPEHKPWCQEGVIEHHVSPTGTGKHFFCATCEGGKCPVCSPGYFLNRRRGTEPLR